MPLIQRLPENLKKIVMKKVSPIAAALLCAACSQGPSNADVERAVRAEYTKINNFAGGAFSDALAVEIHSVKSLGCKAAASSPGYNCDVEIDVTLPILGRHTNIMPARLVKASDGWRLVEME